MKVNDEKAFVDVKINSENFFGLKLEASGFLCEENNEILLNILRVFLGISHVSFWRREVSAE